MFLFKIRKFCGAEGFAIFSQKPPEVCLAALQEVLKVCWAGGNLFLVAGCSIADGDCGSCDCGGRVDGGVIRGRGGGGKGSGRSGGGNSDLWSS